MTEIQKNLVVLREGQPDPDYYNALQADLRHEQVKAVGESVLSATKLLGGYMARQTGRFALIFYARGFDVVNGTDTASEFLASWKTTE